MRRAAVAFGAACLLACAPAAAGQGLPSGRTAYRSYADYLHDIDTLVAAHPGLVRRVVLPEHSVEGRELVGVEIARDVGATGDGRPVALVVGLTHAREWPSGEVAMEYATDLVARASQPRVKALLRGVRTIVVPVLNPDGFIVTQSGQPQRRRNCRAVPGDDPSAPCIRRRGVDLNRNFGAYWGGNGASVSPDSDTYRGSGPWSEPETQAVHELSAAEPVTDVVSLHNVGALVLRPPGFRALGRAPDEDGLRRVGDAMAAAAGYRSELADQLYDVTGALEDWNYIAQGAYGYTVELGENDGDGSFQGVFATHVTQQYFGAHGGMREALQLAGEEAMDPRDHALLTGSAPPGRVLRLRKRFDTMTSPVCTTDLLGAAGGCATTSPAYAVPDGLSLSQTVPRSGRFVWQVGPSTRPFVARDGAQEAWTLECLAADGSVAASHDVVVGRGQRALVAPCVPGGVVRVGADPAARLLRVGAVRVRSGRAVVPVRCAVTCTVTVSGGGVRRTAQAPPLTSTDVRVALPRSARSALVGVVDRLGEHARLRVQIRR